MINWKKNYHLTVWKNLICKMSLEIIYLIYIHNEGLALNNL